MPGYHLFQHVYPGQSAGGLHTKVVWAKARQLHLLRTKFIYPLPLLWKLVSFKKRPESILIIETPSQEAEAGYSNWCVCLSQTSPWLPPCVLWESSLEEKSDLKGPLIGRSDNINCPYIKLPSILGVISRCFHISGPGVKWLHLIVRFVSSSLVWGEYHVSKQCPLLQ